jgi:hypothetical protein
MARHPYVGCSSGCEDPETGATPDAGKLIEVRARELFTG